jgi:ketosteroid isomerase-like protein
VSEDAERLLERIEAGYEAYNRGDFDAAAEHLHPEIEFSRVSDVESSLVGRDAVRENMEPEVWETQQVEVHGSEVIGDYVVVDTTFHAVGSGSGIELHQRGYHLWRAKDGRAVEFRFFTVREDAVQAATAEDYG